MKFFMNNYHSEDSEEGLRQTMAEPSSLKLCENGWDQYFRRPVDRPMRNLFEVQTFSSSNTLYDVYFLLTTPWSSLFKQGNSVVFYWQNHYQLFSIISYFRKEPFRNEYLWVLKPPYRVSVLAHTKTSISPWTNSHPRLNLLLPPLYRQILKILPSKHIRIQPLLQPGTSFDLHPSIESYHSEDTLKSLHSCISL